MDIGEQFSSRESHGLRGSIKDISKSYFESYHRTGMENLAVMLENEMWQKVSVVDERGRGRHGAALV